MTDRVTIAEEPRGEPYVALLDFAMRHRSLFSLAWRDQLEFRQTANAIAAALQADLVSERHTDRWPGTRLVGRRATVRFYRMSPSALSTLGEADCLYAWVAPDRPEDLAFYSAEGRVWLGSIAHERDAFVDPDAIDLQALAAGVQGLRLGRAIGK